MAIDNDDRSVERDSKGRLKKGSLLNPSGLDRKKLMMLRNLESLTPRAIARLGRLIDSENEPVALGAIKEVLDRNLGKVKQSVDVAVTHTHQLHLEALQELADRAKRSQVIDITPIPTQGDLMLEADGRSTVTADGASAAVRDASVAVAPPRGGPPRGGGYCGGTHPPYTQKTGPAVVIFEKRTPLTASGLGPGRMCVSPTLPADAREAVAAPTTPPALPKAVSDDPGGK